LKSHVTEQEFLIEFFGNFGRELGDPKRFYTDNPNDIFFHMERCAKQKKPAFYSIHPYYGYNKVYGIEKLFFEFDWAHEDDEFTEAELLARQKELPEEVKRFISMIIEDFKMQPLIVKSRRGYHIYIYFDAVYQINRKTTFWKVVYKNLQQQFINYYETKYESEMKYCDDATFGDIKRLGRIPLSIHQKSGEKCIIVNRNLKPDKLRSIAFFRLYGLKLNDMKRAVVLASQQLEKKEQELAKRRERHKAKQESGHGFVGEIRACFKEKMEAGEMKHQQRLALLLEAYYADDKYKTVEGMIELFRCFKDFDGDNPEKSTCREQIEWFFEQEKWHVHPYRCVTIQEFGWCIYEKCPLFNRRHKNDQ
jgi:hypothetical protein